MIDTRHCLICRKSNRTVYWHVDPETKELWCFCNACDRGYSLHSYCYQAGIPLGEFLKLKPEDFECQEAKSDEVNAQEWPARFIPLSDPRSKPAVDYISSRGLTPEGDMYYDIDRNGIVFPMYLGNHFCGAQTRFIVPRVHSDGEVQKMDTMPGTRSGLLFYGWNAERFIGDVKYVVVCEGAFNSISLQQALNTVYGGIAKNPWRCVACSGSGASQYHRETLKELKDQGIKIVIAFDTDKAGIKGLKKFKDADACTHYALTEEDADWNDILKRTNHAELAKFFLSKVKKI